MPTTGIGRHGRYDADLEQSRRRRDPVARLSILLGVGAFAAVFVPPARPYGLGACAFAFLLALLARRRARRQGGEVALAGLVLAVFAGVGLVASASAFGSVDGSPAAAPAPGPSGEPATAVPGVLGKDVDVVFGTPHVELEEFGLRRMNVPVTIKNLTGRTVSFDLDFAARESGKEITTDSAFVKHLAPGQSAQIRVFNLVNDKLLDKLLEAKFVTTGAVAY